MRELIHLASSWRGKTGHNPTVAAAVVVDGDVVSRGVHTGDGSPHAEIMAIRDAGSLCKEATLYVTLEPCTHVGKTPPCVDAISAAGFSQVVYAIDDPNPEVRARGGAKQLLSESGISVISGICESDAYALNREFFYTMKTKRPFVTLKVAQSHNAKIPLGMSGKPQMISGDLFLKAVHRLRGQCDVVLTGVGTLIADNPRLTVRYGWDLEGYQDPAVVILDPLGRTPQDAAVFESDRAVYIVVDSERCDVETVQQKYKHALCVGLETVDGTFKWDRVMSLLVSLGYRHVLVEAGSRTVSWAFPYANDIVLGVSSKRLDSLCVDSPLDWRKCEIGYTAELLGDDIVLRKIDT